jgi:hypothetical protein
LALALSFFALVSFFFLGSLPGSSASEVLAASSELEARDFLRAGARAPGVATRRGPEDEEDMPLKLF